MDVKLYQPEIEGAVRLYLEKVEGMQLEGRKLEIEFTAGRNPPTVSAEIKISKAVAGENDAVVVKDAPVPEDGSDATDGDSDMPFSDEQSKLPFQEFLS